MPLLSFIRRRPVPPPPTPAPSPRTVLIEWKDEAGGKVWQQTHLEVERGRGLSVVVRQRPPQDTVAQIRDAGSSYPVEVLGVEVVDGGFELRLDYLWEGRRREHRTAISGPAILKVEGFVEMQVEVVNVSAGGMQLFSSSPASEGASAKVRGVETERLCLVRSCIAATGGYFLGLQFYGENRKERVYGDE